MMADNQAIGLSPCATPGTVCVLGIDLGTTSVKAALVIETEQGQIVAQSCSRETQAQADSLAAGAQGMEQDVQRIIKALNECLAAFPQEHLQRVSRIGISGQMHGVVFWKTNQGCKWAKSGTGHTFQPGEVSHLITWQDGRCSSSFLSSLPQPQSHLSLATGFGCATIYWYLKNSLRESGFPLDLLPEVGDPGDIAGRMPHDWHGIPKGTEVGIALGDFQCSVYSCMTERTDAVLNISTSAQLTVPMPLGFQPPETPDSLSAVAYFPYFDGNYLAVAASLNGGNVLATFVDMLARWMAELGYEVLESNVYTQMINAALAQNDSRLSICPTVFGERHMPEQLASVTSITASDLSLGHVTRALCHGIIQNLHSMLPFQHLKEAGVKRILGSGSALSRNEVLKQEVEKIFPFPVIYGKDVDAAVGAAMVMLHRR
ncbi:sedoheptulokinase isoform X3 [Terrapene carolina triunguis]|uniref:sedoheptulokinase isoform X3 n=1 Tax=Terrapene triunguis TaxID=2587831 RepID=UPI000CEFDAB7|nr:sedoheptulokinase isoform X3 [Terrapene carolina triunguis]